MIDMLQHSFLELDENSPPLTTHPSPPHLPHPSLLHPRPLMPSGSILSLGSTNSLASSLPSDSQPHPHPNTQHHSHSPTHRHRDHRYTSSHLTNGGGAPAISTLLERAQSNGGPLSLLEMEAPPTATPPPSLLGLTTPTSVRRKRSHRLSAPSGHAPSTFDQSDCVSSISSPFPVTSSPRHRPRGVASKTPPPDYDLCPLSHAHPAGNHRQNSLDSESQLSLSDHTHVTTGHAPLTTGHAPNLQLFNTLFEDVLSNHGNSGKGVKLMGRAFSHHISSPHRV